MKKHFLMALALMSVLATHAGKVVTDSIKSTVLNATVKYNIYLPDGFDKSQKKYPAVYLLHGFTDDYTAW